MKYFAFTLHDHITCIEKKIQILIQKHLSKEQREEAEAKLVAQFWPQR